MRIVTRNGYKYWAFVLVVSTLIVALAGGLAHALAWAMQNVTCTF